MGERTYIRNLANSLMGQVKVDQDFFNKWETFPLTVPPGQAMQLHCGHALGFKLAKMSPKTLAKIAYYGRCKGDEGTSLHELVGDWPIILTSSGARIIYDLALATVVAEITDILLERLPEEQRARFRVCS